MPRKQSTGTRIHTPALRNPYSTKNNNKRVVWMEEERFLERLLHETNIKKIISKRKQIGIKKKKNERGCRSVQLFCKRRPLANGTNEVGRFLTEFDDSFFRFRFLFFAAFFSGVSGSTSNPPTPATLPPISNVSPPSQSAYKLREI